MRRREKLTKMKPQQRSPWTRVKLFIWKSRVFHKPASRGTRGRLAPGEGMVLGKEAVCDYGQLSLGEGLSQEPLATSKLSS